MEGHKVLHLDRNNYYGGEGASLNLSQVNFRKSFGLGIVFYALALVVCPVPAQPERTNGLRKRPRVLRGPDTKVFNDFGGVC
jgi:hypothetical protein